MGNGHWSLHCCPHPSRKAALPFLAASLSRLHVRSERHDGPRRSTLMKLYVTPASPYARMARIVVIEKRLESRVEIITAQTRLMDSPYYKIIPRAASLISSVMTALGWKNRRSSAPISITLTATRSSICRPASEDGSGAVSKRWREACWTDSRFGAARSPGRKTSSHRQFCDTKQIAVNGWPISGSARSIIR